MSDENFQFVRQIGHATRDGLGPYVLDSYKFTYSKRRYLEVLQETLGREHPFISHDHALESLDLQAWLKATESRWDEVFSRKLGHTAPEAERNANICNAKSYLYELLNTRNLFSHEAPNDEFTDEDVYRIADTASRLLRAVKRRDEATITEEIQGEFGRRLYSTEAEASQTEPVSDELVPDEAEVQFEASEAADPDAEVNDEEPPRRVDLSGLNLSDMDLRGRNLHLANLAGADLSSSNLQNVNLADMDLSDVKLLKADLSDAKLANSRLDRADLSEAMLMNADLTGTSLSYSTLRKADLRKARIDESDLSFANLSGADISNSKAKVDKPFWSIDEPEFSNLEEELCRAGVNLSHAILCQANMQRVWFSLSSLAGADLTEANLAGARITGVNFSGANLRSANLTQCDMIQCDFTGAKMQDIIFNEAYCIDPKFTNAEMTGAILEGIDCSECEEYEEYNWNNVDLSQATLCNAVLIGQSLRNANLTEADLTDINLMDSDLTNSNLTRAVFTDANLNDANLSNTDLNETNFTGADLTCADFTGAKFYPFSTILPDGTYWDEDTDMTRFTGPLEDC